MLMDDKLRAEEEDTDLDEFPEWQRENIKAAVDIISTDDYSIMEDFCYSIEDEELREEFLYAIRGNGAFRMFKDKIHQYDLEDQWYDYKYQKYKDIAIEWCEENNIEYRENHNE